MIKVFGIENFLCIEFEVKEGKLIGKFVGEMLFGLGKVVVIVKFVVECGGLFVKIYFYVDGFEEVGLMESVGYLCLVNLGSKLFDVVKSNKWLVLKIDSCGSVKLMYFLCNIVGMVSFGLIF